MDSNIFEFRPYASILAFFCVCYKGFAKAYITSKLFPIIVPLPTQTYIYLAEILSFMLQ